MKNKLTSRVLLIVFFSILCQTKIYSQVIGVNDLFEWNIDNTGDRPGEKIVAIIETSTIGSYTGVEIVGTVIDNNGNWGCDLPIVANFKMFLKLSEGVDYQLIQNKKTKYITLGLKKVSNYRYYLTANCPVRHKGMRVIFKKVEGHMSVSMGDPSDNISEEESLISEPEYQSYCTGKFGVGISEPMAELDVDGKIRAKEVQIIAPGTADFVFEEDYPLKPLSEVEQFVKENKHLPEIPSAKKMEKDGVNLAEMNKLLLQKVEELTLYLIKLEKHQRQQQNKNIQLEERIINLTQQIRSLKNE
jgi:hypothetical protein